MPTNSTLTPAVTAKPKRKAKAPARDVTPKDPAYDRNFDKNGKPKLSAMTGTGERAMGQRR
jgi:hypothetical protein